MIAALGVIAALGYASDYVLRLLERRCTPWRVAFESD
jgi:ABC-type nitrate/sulfonate/bicarbonate transport system permease component